MATTTKTENPCRGEGAPCKRDEAPCTRGDETPWWKDKSNLQAARHYAHLKGLLYRSRIATDNSAVNSPLTLQPCDFPQELYEKIWALQPAVNSLVDAVSRDLGFLEEALAWYACATTELSDIRTIIMHFSFIKEIREIVHQTFILQKVERQN